MSLWRTHLRAARDRLANRPAAAPSTAYRPRHPERYEPRWGPLRPVVRPAVEPFLDCGRLQGGFARVRGERCGAEHLLAFSCSCRNFCPSCQANRAALFTEKLVTEVLESVAHQHLVLTIPRAIRNLFRRDRGLLGILARSAYDAIRKTCEATLERRDLRPAVVLSIQTFGSFVNLHPHIHAVLAEGRFRKGAELDPIVALSTSVVEEVFRGLVLTRLNRAQRLSDEFMHNLLSWKHSGFSARLAIAIGAQDRAALERLVRTIVRVPVPAGTVRIANETVIVDTQPDPRTRATQLRLDPLSRGRTVHWTVRHVENGGGDDPFEAPAPRARSV